MSFESDGDAQDDHDDALDHFHYQGSQRNEEKLAEASSNDKIEKLLPFTKLVPFTVSGKRIKILRSRSSIYDPSFLLRQP